MIKLVKLEEPQVLKDNAAAWLKVLQDKLAAGDPPTEAEKSRYRHPSIKKVLTKETHGKCAYCESYLLHVAFGDVEHIIPKSLKLSESFRWENLTLACDRCNTSKSNSINIVDPYLEDPANIFAFIGPMVFPKSDNDRGVNTERRLKLNRTELVERRIKRLRTISDQLVLIAKTKDAETKAALEQDLREVEAADDSEFAAFTRSFIEQILPKVTNQ